MLNTEDFLRTYKVRHILALSQNGGFEVTSIIYRSSRGVKLYAYYSTPLQQYIVEPA